MNTEALIQLVRVLQTVRDNDDLAHSFNLISWVKLCSPEDRIKFNTLFQSLPMEERVGIPHTCGTTACAAGYAGLDAWFNQKGFAISRAGEPTFAYDGFTLHGWPAVQKFFDLTSFHSNNLFSAFEYHGVDYVTPQHVIDRIHKMLLDEEAKCSSD